MIRSVAVGLAMLAAAALGGCATILPGKADPAPPARLEPAPRSEPAPAPRAEAPPPRSEPARPAAGPSPAPAASEASRAAEASRATEARMAEEIARMAAEFSELQNALARLVASSQRQEEQLRALERRVGEMAATPAPEPSVPRGFAPSQVSPGAPPAAPSSSTRTAQELYDAGTARMRDGELDAAQILFQDLVANHPSHPLRESAQFLAADILYRQNDPRGALAEFEALLVAVPGGRRTPEALLKMGLAQRKLGSEDQARRTWERLIREYPKSAQASEARSILRPPRSRTRR